MNIMPIRPIEFNLETPALSGLGEKGGPSFADVFKNAIQNVNETEAAVKKDEMLIAMGQADNLHSITINLAKADLALQTLVQVRNKAVEAYNEVMRITL